MNIVRNQKSIFIFQCTKFFLEEIKKSVLSSYQKMYELSIRPIYYFFYLVILLVIQYCKQTWKCMPGADQRCDFTLVVLYRTTDFQKFIC